MRVILIDDDEDLRTAVQLALKSSGFAADAFADCDLARSRIEATEELPEAILLDVHLDGAGTPPGAFIAWLREGRTRRVPVLLMTAAHDAKTLAVQLGADGFLSKPFDVRTLLGRLETISRRA